MRPIAVDVHGKIVLENVPTCHPLRLHFGIGRRLAGSKPFDARVVGENVIVQVGAKIHVAVTSGPEGPAKSGAI